MTGALARRLSRLATARSRRFRRTLQEEACGVNDVLLTKTRRTKSQARAALRLYLRPRLVANVFGFIILAFGLVLPGRLARLFFALGEAIKIAEGTKGEIISACCHVIVSRGHGSAAPREPASAPPPGRPIFA